MATVKTVKKVTSDKGRVTRALPVSLVQPEIACPDGQGILAPQGGISQEYSRFVFRYPSVLERLFSGIPLLTGFLSRPALPCRGQESSPSSR